MHWTQKVVFQVIQKLAYVFIANSALAGLDQAFLSIFVRSVHDFLYSRGAPLALAVLLGRDLHLGAVNQGGCRVGSAPEGRN
jgi:hypothetical protein